MKKRRKWTRDETIIAFNLYCKTQFGQMHARNPRIIELSNKLERSPNSVAMKLCNFASLDPGLEQRGLENASRLDKQIWNEFHSNWETQAAESEKSLEELTARERTNNAIDDKQQIVEDEISITHGPTEFITTTTQRRGQQFFRKTILASYGFKCAVTGCPLPELLIASHILPWAKYPEQRVNPRNGICLAAHFDRAFDHGLISFDDDYKLLLSRRIKENLKNEFIKHEFIKREGISLRLPTKFLPENVYVKEHRQNVFIN